MKIGIVDYGAGNLVSVSSAVERLGFDPIIASRDEDLAASAKFILPGVGAFGDGMRMLQSRGLDEALERLVLEEGRPLLGICLGFQLIGQGSSEFGDHKGLGWIDGTVHRLVSSRSDLRVPHVGWNDLTRKRESFLYDGIPEGALFYYVHSYCMTDSDSVVGECVYGERFAAVIQKDNVFGTQFHPEKSQESGLRLLQNFLVKA